MKIDERAAEEVLRAAANGGAGATSPDWLARITEFSELCANNVSRTHVAFLGTSILARATNANADLFAIKPTRHRDNPNAYSARDFCQDVLVPLAAELGINIGVSGRQPLNGKMYLQMSRLGDDTPVHSGARPAFNYMIRLVKELQEATPEEAQRALAAFVAVRRKYRVSHADHGQTAAVSPAELTDAIAALVRKNSEGGRRAQAIAAGVFDVVFGAPRVESGRINDPSRRHPGDVCIRREEGADQWTKAVEVRDKPVSASDVRIFATGCAAHGVREVAVLMVSDRQQQLDDRALHCWADDLGVGLTLFYGWPTFVDQSLFWAVETKPEAAALAVSTIRERLIAIEASTEATSMWSDLTTALLEE
jgi:hypothetical protein